MPKVGVAQVGSVMFDTAATLAKLREFVDRAKAAGAEFLVFPEAFVGGYPKGLSFGAVVGSRTPAGRDEYVRYRSSAVTVPGPETAQIGEFARQSGMTIVVGVIERDGGTLYCTAVYFGCDGQLLGKHRKLMPTGSERLIWGQGDGSTIEVYDSPAGSLPRQSAGKTTCPSFVSPPISRAYSCGARRRSMIVISGSRPCGTSHTRDGVSCSAPASI